MACSKAAAVDLAAFLADPDDPALAEFRAHYPACPTCRLEVSTWLALHDRLREPSLGDASGHPAEVLLLALEDRPASLEPKTRRQVEEHLLACASCRDEQASLRAFDFTRLAPAAEPKRSWRTVAVETLAGIRTLMLHPAFAYGLVVLALLPNLILWRAAREAAAPATARSVPLAVTAPPHAEPPAQGYDMRALREEDVAGHATALMAPDARKAEAVARAAREPAENGTLEGLATAARPSPQAPRKPEAHWTTVVLGAGLGLAAAGESADDLPSVARAELDAGIELKLPVRVFRVGGPFEVQITKPDGASKLSQSFPSATVGLVSMNIPAAWLTPGQYQVAMRSATESSREFARFRFEVH